MEKGEQSSWCLNIRLRDYTLTGHSRWQIIGSSQKSKQVSLDLRKKTMDSHLKRTSCTSIFKGFTLSKAAVDALPVINEPWPQRGRLSGPWAIDVSREAIARPVDHNFTVIAQEKCHYSHSCTSKLTVAIWNMETRFRSLSFGPVRLKGSGLGT